MNRNVFISYSRRDQKIISKISKSLQKNGLNVWVDTNNIRWGDNVGEEIEKAIISNEYIMFCISKDWISSQWCNQELEIAINAKKFGNQDKKVLLSLLLDKEGENFVKKHKLLTDINYRVFENDPDDLALALIKIGYKDSLSVSKVWNKFKNTVPSFEDYLALDSNLPDIRKRKIAKTVIELIPKLKEHRRQHIKKIRSNNQGNSCDRNKPAWVRISTTQSEKTLEGYRLCLGFKNTPCSYRSLDPLKIGCFNCGFYAGTNFKKATREEIINQVKYALMIAWANKQNFDVIELLSDGSFLSDAEINDEIKVELFRYFSKMPYVSRILVESTPEHIWTEAKEVPNLLEMLSNHQTLEIGIGFETSDDFIRKACINKGFSKYEFEEALSKISDLPTRLRGRCRIVAYLLVKPAFLTATEYINDCVNTIRYLSKIEKKYNISIIPKLEPAAISNGTILSLLYYVQNESYRYTPLNYWSILEILTRIREDPELKDIFLRIRIGAREDMDEIIKVPAVYNDDGYRFDTFDFILYSAMQQFNQHHDLSKIYATIQITYPVHSRRYPLLSPSSSLGKWYRAHMLSSRGKYEKGSIDSGLLGIGSFENCAIERYFKNHRDIIDREMETETMLIDKEFLLATNKALDIIEGYTNSKYAKILRDGIVRVLEKNNYSFNNKNKHQLEESLSNCFETDLTLFQIKLVNAEKVSSGIVRIFFDAIDFISGKTYPVWSECYFDNKFE